MSRTIKTINEIALESLVVGINYFIEQNFEENPVKSVSITEDILTKVLLKYYENEDYSIEDAIAEVGL